MKTDATDHEPREQAALYALGALDPTEAARFEAHLAEGCARCQREMHGFAAVVADLGHGVRTSRPDPALRARVLARAHDADDRGIVVHPDDVRWEHGARPGISVKRLFGEPAGARQTMVVRFAPRARWTADDTGAHHELYVLDGRLTVGDATVGPGDYVATGAIDGLAGDGGCTLVVAQSMRERDAPTAVVRATEQGWRPGGAVGITVKRLVADPGMLTVTALVRMDPGARLPRHRHVTSERFYMLTGDLHVSGHEMGPGAFCAAAAGTVHEGTYSRGGCEFLLIASQVELL